MYPIPYHLANNLLTTRRGQESFAFSLVAGRRTTKKSGLFIKGSGRFPNLSCFSLAAQLFSRAVFNPIFAIQHVVSSFFFLVRPFTWSPQLPLDSPSSWQFSAIRIRGSGGQFYREKQNGFDLHQRKSIVNSATNID